MGVEEGLRSLEVAAADGSLATLCERHGVEVLTLFGSAVDDPSTARDLDVGVVFRHHGDVVELTGDLMDLTSIDAVDVLPLNAAPPAARFAALVRARPLYESAPGRWATAQVSAAVEFYETEWLRRLDLERLAR